jgi:putative oxidoreductase
MLDLLFTYGDAGILLLRLPIAIIFLVHGTKKLDGSMGNFMRFIGVAETLGGLAILLGFLTQLAALGLAIIMIGALYKKIVEWKVPFTAMDKMGWEFDLMILGACAALMTLGSGAYGIDAQWWY